MDYFMKIEVPEGLTEQQIKLAKAYVTDRYTIGISINTFCKKYSISTKTWYVWLENKDFESYLTELQKINVTEEELKDFSIVANMIKEDAKKEGASVKERELYLRLHEPVAEAFKQKQMNEMGIGVISSEELMDKHIQSLLEDTKKKEIVEAAKAIFLYDRLKVSGTPKPTERQYELYKEYETDRELLKQEDLENNSESKVIGQKQNEIKRLELIARLTNKS